MIIPQLQQIFEFPNFPPDLKEAIQKVIEDIPVKGEHQTLQISTSAQKNNLWSKTSTTPASETSKTDKLIKRITCRYCPTKLKRKTSTKCIQCGTPSCRSCYMALCNKCVRDLN
ncbi:hypothetical protein HHI36_019994 [Cryptolaemus montrouzieri]|uniref:PiggyBac transposable element-derived protein 4 C-terminal zinc-ribbon domain-containing protein n=1 Tax=Cryptolaemus montrouzieri TaxID=559131 RepID=A0ABD2NA10_9CUCU